MPFRSFPSYRLALFTFAALFLAFGLASADTFVVTNIERCRTGLAAAGHPRRERGCGRRRHHVQHSRVRPFRHHGRVQPFRRSTRRWRHGGRNDPAGLLDARPLIGTGGTVGVDQLALPQLRSPIVQVFGNGLAVNGLSFTAATTRRFAVCTSGASPGPTSPSPIRTMPRVELNLIGATAAFGDPGPGLRAGINLLLDSGSNSVVRNNLVAFADCRTTLLIASQRGQFLVTGQ